MKIKSWSYSQLSSYEMCPHAYMYERVVKLEKPPSWALTNGNYIHKLAENFLLGKIEEPTKELAKFKKEFYNLRNAGAVAEQPIVLRSDWSFLGNEEAWTHEEAWLRLKIDASVGDDYLIDFKTGRQYPEHIKQGRLYANVMLMLNENQQSADVEFWYLTSGEVVDYTFTRDTLEQDVDDWNRRVEVMRNDTEYKPTPHQWCRNCFVKHLCTAYN